MSSLDNLSDELRLAIIEFLETGEPRDFLNLSSTCHSFRALLTPNIFRKVPLRNDEKSGLAMQEFLRSGRNIYVKELHYKGVTAIPPDRWSVERDGEVGWEDNDEDEEGDDEELDELKTVFSEPTREVLCDLKRFPSLERLIVEFPWSKEDTGVGFHHFEHVESEEKVLARERKVAWRALMARTYAAVGENQDFSTIKSLDLRLVPARRVSSWWTTNFQTFLGSLQDFTLSTFAMRNASGWSQNTNAGYLDFLARLGDDLTSHLQAVETLTIVGNRQGPIGCEGMRHAPSSLESQCMPKLRHLLLRNFFLDRPLIEFIENRLETLETIHLDECYGTEGQTLAQC